MATIDQISAVGLSEGPGDRLVVYLVRLSTVRGHQMQLEPATDIPEEYLIPLWSHGGRINKLKRVTGGADPRSCRNPTRTRSRGSTNIRVI